MNDKVLLLVTCSTVFVAQLGMSIYLPAVPQIAHDLNASVADVSWGLAVYLIGMAFPMLLWGNLSERIGRKPVLLASLSIYALANIALPWSVSIESFLSFRLIQGIGASGISVMARVLIRESFSGELLAKALSWLSISFVIALGIGQYLGSQIQIAFGWNAIFYALGTVSLLMAGLIRRTPFAAVPEAGCITPDRRHYFRLLSDWRFLRATLAGGLGYGVIIAFNTCAPLILQSGLHWSAAEYGLLGWPISAAYFLGALMVNRFVAQTGRWPLMSAGMVLMLCGSATMLLGSVFASSVALLLWLPYCLAVLGQSLSYPISLSLANDEAPVSGSYAMVLSGFMHQVMAVLIGSVASLLASQQAWPLALLCLVLASGALACVVSARRS